MRPVLIQQPQVVLDTTALENTFDNMGQSMLQLARVQDQTNRHLQQHIQQGQVNMQAHAGALHELANSTQQRNYDHIFASIPVYDGSNRDDFFPWLDRLEAACYNCGRDIKTEALGRSAGPGPKCHYGPSSEQTMVCNKRGIKTLFLRSDFSWSYSLSIREHDSKTK